jgi:hypothetical protein
MTGLVFDEVAGGMVGRDPREMTKSDLETLGHEVVPILSVIRAKCLDCCAAQQSEVRRCVSIKCALWPYRMGSNPMRDKREMSDEQRAVITERFAAARASKVQS